MGLSANRCIASPWTSAGAVVVTTGPATLCGISYSGSAAAAVIDIFSGVSTAGARKVSFTVGITGGSIIPINPGIICNGIVATNVGTLAGYAILYSTC